MAKYGYNLVVIGAGSAGLVSSYIAAAGGAKVALIEKHRMGGDCLNTGCVPSKAIIRSASFMRDVKRAQSLGFSRAEADYDFAAVMERVQRVIKKIEPHDSVERFTSLGVECHIGTAKIISPHEVEVNGTVLTTRSIIVAAGAAPFVPPITGVELVKHYTSDTIWELRDKPEKMVVVGGGPIGSELAQAFAFLGIEVTQIEGSARILPREDEDAAELVMEGFSEANVNLMTNSRVVAFEVQDGKQTVVVEQTASGETNRVPFDIVLFATGRRGNGKKVEGLAECGVKVNDAGFVAVNDKLQTDVKNIFACGDIIGSYQFTHTASHAAVTATINALSPFPLTKINWSIVPWCTFTHPEVARVGLSEKEAKTAGVEHEVTKYGIDDLDRAIADEEAHGFVKLITNPKGKILGVTIVGDHAGDLIHEYILAMKQGLKVTDIMGMIHIYPTLSESNRFAASEWKKKHINQGVLNFFKKFNTYLRG